MGENVVVVESPAKAKTLERYLGAGFTVLASYGHVRDLPAKDGSVRPDEDFAMTYEIEARAAKHLAAIAKAVKGADTLYLATDPDREGEAISWHVAQALDERRVLDGVTVKRVAFHEITKSAVLDAMAHPRELDMDLVNAQQARRALDYLVGFTLSPVLWRKLPGSRSAGRVQSVALRLVCQRETEIEAFRPREYWTVETAFATPGGDDFTARLTHLDGAKLGKYDLGDEAAARAAAAAIEAREFAVAVVEALPARCAARLPLAREERPGGPRGDPPDLVRPTAGRCRWLSRSRPAAALRAVLEARRGEPAGERPDRPGHGRHRLARRRRDPARHRLTDRLRRLPQALPRGPRRHRRGRPGRR